MNPHPVVLTGLVTELIAEMQIVLGQPTPHLTLAINKKGSLRRSLEKLREPVNRTLYWYGTGFGTKMSTPSNKISSLSNVLFHLLLD